MSEWTESNSEGTQDMMFRSVSESYSATGLFEDSINIESENAIPIHVSVTGAEENFGYEAYITLTVNYTDGSSPSYSSYDYSPSTYGFGQLAADRGDPNASLDNFEVEGLADEHRSASFTIVWMELGGGGKQPYSGFSTPETSANRFHSTAHQPRTTAFSAA